MLLFGWRVSTGKGRWTGSEIFFCCTFGTAYSAFGMKEFKLDFSDSDYVTENDIKVVSIQAPDVPSYTLAHFLNKQLSWGLCHTGKNYCPATNPAFAGDLFNYVMEVEHVQCMLLSNKDGRNYWIEEASDVDYWLILIGAGLGVFDVEAVVDAILSLPFVFYAGTYGFQPKKRGKKTQVFGHFQAFYMDMDDQNMLHCFD